MPEDQAETVHLSPQTQQEYIRNGRIFRAHSEHKLWTMKRSRIIPALKGQEKNEGKGTGKEVEWDLQLWGDLKRGESPHPGKLFTGWGAQLRQKRSLILCGKRTQQQSVAAGQCETCTQATDPCPAHPEWEGVHHCRQGLGAGMWGLESRSRQWTAVGPLWGAILQERQGGRSSINRDVVAEAWTTIQHSAIADWWRKKNPTTALPLLSLPSPS